MKLTVLKPAEAPPGIQRLLALLQKSLAEAEYTTCRIIVAFARLSGVARLLPQIMAWRSHGRSIEAIVGIDWFGTSLEAPTGFCEVEWWNKGRRSAEKLLVQVDLPGRFITWELIPPPTDVSAPCRCLSDPCAAGEPNNSIRIQQEHLMPGTRCRLVLGFDSPESDATPSIRRYRDGQPMPPPKSLSDFWVFLTVGTSFGGASLVYWLGARALRELRGVPELGRNDTTLLLLVAGAVLVGMFVVWTRAIRYISTGYPSWHIPPPLEKEKRQ